MTAPDELKSLKKRHAARLWTNPAVCGIDIGDDQDGNPVFTVDLRSDESVASSGLPQQIEGHRVIYRYNPIEKQEGH
jgi:hypothetical protein